jgi:hypothetical protein
MYSDTIYSETGLFWQYTTYMCSFRSYRLNKGPNSSGCSVHFSSAFKKKLKHKKKKKYHIIIIMTVLHTAHLSHKSVSYGKTWEIAI